MLKSSNSPEEKSGSESGIYKEFVFIEILDVISSRYKYLDLPIIY